jgi:hypothetical protein
MNQSILLVTSNGFGMGHLVRQLAIADALSVRTTILTLSQAAPVAIAAGARLEYCPSYTSPWINKRDWHRGYLEERITALAEEVDADLIAFDGVVPYIGLLNALRRSDAASVWFRRGVWRSDSRTSPLEYSDLFDLVIEPGDVGAPRDAGPTRLRGDAVRVGVVTQAGGKALLSREEAARHLGVDPSRPTLLLNIGSNRIPELEKIEKELVEQEEWNILSTHDALARNRSASQGSSAPTVRRLSGVFPLHPYLSAIDLAVTSVGYNAAHEFLACSVPTILVPAINATDDQHARAFAIADRGAGVVVESGAPEELRAALALLMTSSERRDAMRASAKQIAAEWGNGAAESAEILIALKEGSLRPHSRSVRAAMRRTGRNIAERALALRGSRGGAARFRLTATLTAEDLSGEVAVEHLHPESSSRYALRRAAIASRWMGNQLPD